jgi:OFA family oxalate/formate antiporter-like MFS transporter
MKKSQIFYGWYIVVAFLLIWLVYAGIAVYSFTAFIEPLSNLFGWNYTQVTFASSLRAVSYVLLMPIAGLVVDRWSARKLVFAGIICTSIGIFLLSWINSLGQLYLCYILMGIGGITCTATIPVTVVGRWFRRKVSFATSIVMSASGFGGLLVPLVTRVIDTAGLHTAMLFMGLSIFVIISPLSLIIRRSPEQYGYLPDGDVNDNTVPGEGQDSIHSNDAGSGIKQDLKSSPFWHITLAFMCLTFATVGVQVHTMPYMSTIGIDRTTSSFLASAMLISGIFGRLFFGWFGDKFDKRWVAASGAILVGLGLLLFTFTRTDTTQLLIPAFILCGIGWGGAIMHPVLLREYFGTSNLGAVIGFSISIITIAFIVSPPLVSWIFERFGDYRIAWFILIGMVIISVISQLTNPSATTRQKVSSSTNGI